MDKAKYLELSSRTHKKFEGGKHLTELQMDLLHGALGAVGESGELVDLIKKHIYKEQALDLEKVKEEVGDILWYCALLARLMNVEFDSLLQGNIDKLEKRYGAKND